MKRKTLDGRTFGDHTLEAWVAHMRTLSPAEQQRAMDKREREQREPSESAKIVYTDIGHYPAPVIDRMCIDDTMLGRIQELIAIVRKRDGTRGRQADLMEAFLQAGSWSPTLLAAHLDCSRQSVTGLLRTFARKTVPMLRKCAGVFPLALSA